MKSILKTVAPEVIKRIFDGKQQLLVTKDNPKCDLPIDVYIYCTKGKKQYVIKEIENEHKSNQKYVYELETKEEVGKYLNPNRISNGKVVAKFTLNKVERIDITNENKLYVSYSPIHKTYKATEDELLKASYLSSNELRKYLKPIIPNNSNYITICGYVWHISNLVIFDEPMELWNFMSLKSHEQYLRDLEQAWENDDETMTRLYEGLAMEDECANSVELTEMAKPYYGLTKAPKSWQYVEVEEE